MIVYFLRHASAGEKLPSAKKDDKRGLDREGIEQCGYVGRALAAMEVQVEPALRPEATILDFRRLLQKYGRLEAIMVVGHNPNLSEFLGHIISDAGGEANVELRKGAVARVELRRSSGSLSWCLTPKVLRALHAAATESSLPKTSRK